MKNLTIKSKLLLSFLLITFILTFDAGIGSYQESEPHAGNILFTVAGIIFLILSALYFKYKDQLKK